jgi:hypothetical protein
VQNSHVKGSISAGWFVDVPNRFPFIFCLIRGRIFATAAIIIIMPEKQRDGTFNGFFGGQPCSGVQIVTKSEVRGDIV